jgi:cyclic beta-1,2-glucan synthetase
LPTPITPIEALPPSAAQPAPTEISAGRLTDRQPSGASHQAITYAPQAQHLLQRLPQQAKRLQKGYHTFRTTTTEALAFSYAAEWLLDNFYVVQQTQQQIEEDLSPGFYRHLPRLNSGAPLQDYPRIYDLARQLLIAETCQLDLERIHQFVWAYQAVTPLTMGELWALPIMLRLVLLESMTQAIGRLATCRLKRQNCPRPCSATTHVTIRMWWRTVSPVCAC